MARLAARAYLPGDPLPAVGATCLVAGANTDITCDQDRSYGERIVIGYSPCGGFICLQTSGCWPSVERLTNCWFAPEVASLDIPPEDAVTTGMSIKRPTVNPEPEDHYFHGSVEEPKGRVVGYHVNHIPRGVLGEPSKVHEECMEFVDACQQGVSIMALVEAADLLGALEAWMANYHPSMDIADLQEMNRVTKRAFAAGARQPRT